VAIWPPFSFLHRRNLACFTSLADAPQWEANRVMARGLAIDSESLPGLILWRRDQALAEDR
jgi:hypothetical protein